jgi:hypothetical protein
MAQEAKQAQYLYLAPPFWHSSLLKAGFAEEEKLFNCLLVRTACERRGAFFYFMKRFTRVAIKTILSSINGGSNDVKKTLYWFCRKYCSSNIYLCSWLF